MEWPGDCINWGGIFESVIGVWRRRVGSMADGELGQNERSI